MMKVPPQSPQDKGSRYLSDRNSEVAICYRKSFENGSFDLKLKGLVPILLVQRDWWAIYHPPMPIISPNISNQSLEIAIFVQHN